MRSSASSGTTKQSHRLYDRSPRLLYYLVSGGWWLVARRLCFVTNLFTSNKYTVFLSLRALAKQSRRLQDKLRGRGWKTPPTVCSLADIKKEVNCICFLQIAGLPSSSLRDNLRGRGWKTPPTVCPLVTHNNKKICYLRRK